MCLLIEVENHWWGGNEVAANVAGELITRGPYTISRLFYKAPETLTPRSFDSLKGFYHSGDLVCRNEKGYLTVVEAWFKTKLNRGGEKSLLKKLKNLVTEAWSWSYTVRLSLLPDSIDGEKKLCFLFVPKNWPLMEWRAFTLRSNLRSLAWAIIKVPDRFEFIESLRIRQSWKTKQSGVDVDVIRQRLQQDSKR